MRKLSRYADSVLQVAPVFMVVTGVELLTGLKADLLIYSVVIFLSIIILNGWDDVLKFDINSIDYRFFIVKRKFEIKSITNLASSYHGVSFIYKGKNVYLPTFRGGDMVLFFSSNNSAECV